MQYPCFCGMREDQLDATNLKWAPKRAYSLIEEFANLRERVQEKFKVYCMFQISLLLQMNAQIEGTEAAEELDKIRIK